MVLCTIPLPPYTRHGRYRGVNGIKYYPYKYNITRSSRYAKNMKLLLVTSAIASSLQSAMGEFTSIAGSYGDVTSVNINPTCTNGSVLPSTMFTISPSDTASVSSDPADLVTVTTSGGTLSFTWNEAVGSGAKVSPGNIISDHFETEETAMHTVVTMAFPCGDTTLWVAQYGFDTCALAFMILCDML